MAEGQTGAVLPLPPLGGLVGRESDVDGVRRRLDQWGSVTLTGPPGVGKSRLAAEVASHVEASGVPGVVVCVEGLSEPGDIAPTTADALAAVENIGARPGAECEEHPLVLLDDFDRALDASAEVAHRLVARGIRVLATAREPLGIEGESLWRVAPLAVPVVGGDQFPALAESEAVELSVSGPPLPSVASHSLPRTPPPGVERRASKPTGEDQPHAGQTGVGAHRRGATLRPDADHSYARRSTVAVQAASTVEYLGTRVPEAMVVSRATSTLVRSSTVRPERASSRGPQAR